MDTELVCLRQFYHFCRRHRRYAVLFLAMYAGCFFRWRRTRVLRAAYCFIQLMDDIMDGDRQITSSPVTLATAIITEIQDLSFRKNNDASQLAAFIFAELAERHDFDILRTQFIELITVLLQDYERRINRSAMQATDLTQHHSRTFELSMDLTLALAGSKIRSSQCPEIIHALAWCSVMRDLREDLAVGLINIPAEITTIPAASLSEADINIILGKPAVKNWVQSEFEFGKQNISALENQLLRLNEARGRKIIKIFWKSIRSYVPKYEKRYSSVLTPV